MTFKGSGKEGSRPVIITIAVAVLPLASGTAAGAQQTQTAPQTRAQTRQTQNHQQPETPPAQTGAAAPVAEAVAARAPEPLYKEYKGVTLGMSAADVRTQLGKPQEKSDEMDFFVFNDRERARAYYRDGKTSAVIATYIGRNAEAPAPAAVLGTEIEAKPDGSVYQMSPYPRAGYWVAYSRTAGDEPMTIIIMQKSP